MENYIENVPIDSDYKELLHNEYDTPPVQSEKIPEGGLKTIIDSRLCPKRKIVIFRISKEIENFSEENRQPIPSTNSPR